MWAYAETGSWTYAETGSWAYMETGLWAYAETGSWAYAETGSWAYAETGPWAPPPGKAPFPLYLLLWLSTIESKCFRVEVLSDRK